MTTTQRGESPPALGRRNLGLDVTRGLAVVSMYLAHVAPVEPGYPHLVRAVLYGTDSLTAPLFALLLGVSFGLSTGGARTTPARSPGGYVSRTVVRALWLIVLGLLLSTLGAWIVIVLQYLGVTLLLLIPFARLRPAWLLAAAAVLAVLGTPLQAALTPPRLVLAPGFGRDLLDWLAAGHYYRATTLLCFALVGLALARLGIERLRVLWVSCAAGLVLVAGGFALALATGSTVKPYTGTIPETLFSCGLVLLAFGLVSLACAGDYPGLAWVLAVARPVAAVGAMTLTLYSLQILVLAAWQWAHPPTGADDDSWLMFFALLAGSLLLAVLWRRHLGKGPLERLVAWPTMTTRPKPHAPTPA